MPRRAAHSAITLALALAVFSLGACNAAKSSFENPAPYARPFPKGLPQGDTLDIHVFRNIRKLELTNTTPETLGPGTIWINQWFSAPIDTLTPGETVVMNLEIFVDEYGEPIRPGGFFATKPPDRVVKAQLEQDGPSGTPTLRPLLVVADRLE